ncbi:phosphodiester glycosidase family protein [Salimicrobium flavidum]|uniref:Phosphodiester glycosidase domain-containing protein n=1 Tax=Salimicrobium flavidum TaxID=570947 RepID=A0A1N7IZR0_9BACI|nr:phosphodiester glycosidase family protein [Salimicrobium flavidum]SIS42605.1 Predicted protein [Salimicrobium flavidum]
MQLRRMYLVLIFLFLAPVTAHASWNVTDEFEPAPTVDYFSKEGVSQQSDLLKVNVSDPKTTIKLGTPAGSPGLATLTEQAQRMSHPGNRVVGGVNGSFFHFSHPYGNGMPAYFVMNKSKIDRLGAVSSDPGDYFHDPAAFGMDKGGEPVIGDFELDMQFTYKNEQRTVDTMNTARGAGEAVVYSQSYRYDYTRTNTYGMEVVIENTNKSIEGGEVEFGDTITGEITSVRHYGDSEYATIPEEGYVLSFGGWSLSKEYEEMKVGETVSLNVDIADKWKSTSFMLGSGPKLVQNGRVDISMQDSSYRYTQRAPRTAVGTNADGSEVFLVTVDGRQSNALGMTMEEFAVYLREQGVYNAINLDGGGSTQMAARNHAYIYPTIKNTPSDGRQRSIANTLLATVNNGEETPTSVSFYKEQNGKVFPGASVAMDLHRVFDAYNTLQTDVTEKDVTWSVEGGVGYMDGSTFIAEQPGEGEIVAEIGEARAEREITVTTDIAEMKISPEEVLLDTEESKQFQITAKDENGENIIYEPSSVEWNVSGEAGTITDSGLLTTGASRAAGEVTARLGSTSVSADIAVGREPADISGFENGQAWSVQTARSDGEVRGSKGIEPVGAGDYSLRLEYDFDIGVKGIAATYAKSEAPLSIPSSPKQLGVRVHGDGGEHWLRAHIVDGEGERHNVDFTEEDGLDWTGWKYVKADLPEDLPQPITFSRIYLAEASENEKDHGVIFLDELKALYDSTEVELPEATDYQVVTPSKEWTVEFNREMNPETFTSETVYILDNQGDRHETSLRFNDKRDKVFVSADDLTMPEAYELVIEKDVEAANGNPMEEKATKLFLTR